MLLEEARWLARCFERTDNADLFPLVNVGSSTAVFRTLTQPFIQRELFDPLSRRGGQVVHVDLKASPGVDIVGDLTDPMFITTLANGVTAHAVLVSNLLEHVTNRDVIARHVVDMVPVGGLIFVSGPHGYPYHPDPIDTGFRPSLAEVHALFPGTTVFDSAIITSTTWHPWGTNPQSWTARARYFARLCLPIYRPGSWWRAVKGAPYMWRRVSAYAIVLSKGEPAVDRWSPPAGESADAG